MFRDKFKILFIKNNLRIIRIHLLNIRSIRKHALKKVKFKNERNIKINSWQSESSSITVVF